MISVVKTVAFCNILTIVPNSKGIVVKIFISFFRNGKKGGFVHSCFRKVKMRIGAINYIFLKRTNVMDVSFLCKNKLYLHSFSF